MRVRSSANPTRWRTTRVAGAALALLCLGAQLSSLAHLALVRHVTCAEHGEAVDSPQSQSPAAHAWNFTPQHAHGAAASSGDRPESESHEHCLLDQNRDSWALVVHGAIVVPCAAQSTAEAAPHARIAVAPLSDLCLLAPKTSPPA